MSDITPLGNLPFESFSLTLADATTVVEADPAPYNNTKELLVLNTSATDRVFMQIVSAGETPALPDTGDVTAANSVIIPVNGAVALCIGVEGRRQAIGTIAHWTANQGSNLLLVFQTESGTNVVVNVTYVQDIGGI